MKALIALTALLLTASAALAQAPVHYPQRANLPPGAIGQHQLLRGGPLPGYFQPVRVYAPSGAKIALSADGSFFPAERNEVQAGMLIGSVYRMKVTGIPRHEGLELYPTVEVINRLYPPQGEEHKFPIQVEIAEEDMLAALNGRFVTRVIYLENPEIARPERDDPEHQSYFDVLPTEDPLLAADRLGKPMAILRIGSRVPTHDELDLHFFFGNPALQLYGPLAPAEEQPEQPQAEEITRQGGYPLSYGLPPEQPPKSRVRIGSGGFRPLGRQKDTESDAIDFRNMINIDDKAHNRPSTPELPQGEEITSPGSYPISYAWPLEQSADVPIGSEFGYSSSGKFVSQSRDDYAMRLNHFNAALPPEYQPQPLKMNSITFGTPWKR